MPATKADAVGLFHSKGLIMYRGTNIYPNYTMKALSKFLVHLEKKRPEIVWQE
jgi:hypothetical protein